MSNHIATIAISAVAIVAVSSLVSRFTRKPAPVQTKPQYRKLTREEQNAKVLEYARQRGASPAYLEVMELMGNAVDFSQTNPLYERVVN